MRLNITISLLFASTFLIAQNIKEISQNYIDENVFEKAGIEVEYMDYDNYPEYPQISTSFTHQVSIVDLLFQVGPEAPFHIWGWRL